MASISLSKITSQSNNKIPVSKVEIFSITPVSYLIHYYNERRSPVGLRSGASGGKVTVTPHVVGSVIRV